MKAKGELSAGEYNQLLKLYDHDVMQQNQIENLFKLSEENVLDRRHLLKHLNKLANDKSLVYDM